MSKELSSDFDTTINKFEVSRRDVRLTSHVFRGTWVAHRIGTGGPLGYLQSTRLSCEAMICQAPPRFSQVSVQTWHTFAFG